MFTKSQLVATAVLVASASSIVASPIYNDVTGIEARSYSRDALAELKRRAVLEYIEELEARNPTDSTAHSTHGNSGKPHGKETFDVPPHHGQGAVHLHTSSEKQTTAHKPHQPHHRHQLSSSNKPEKVDGQRKAHTHGSSEHKPTPWKESSSPVHHHNNFEATAPPHNGQPHVGSQVRILKRSVLEYLEDLVGRAPSDSAPASGVTKATPPGEAKKDTGGQDQQSSLHRQASIHGGRRLYNPHGSTRRVALSQEPNSNVHGQKTTTVHDPHHPSSLHVKNPERHRDNSLKVDRQHAVSANSPVAQTTRPQIQNGAANHASPVPVHQKTQQTVKGREIEELAELIARELDLYDELD